MVIAWMFCASTGILFARYFKFLFPKWKPFELQVWFVVHRPLMMFVAFASVIGFIIILADSDWKWLDTKIVANFVHSIFGIVTIGLSVIQVINSSGSYCFDWLRVKLKNEIVSFFRLFIPSGDQTKPIQNVLYSITFTELLEFRHLYFQVNFQQSFMSIILVLFHIRDFLSSNYNISGRHNEQNEIGSNRLGDHDWMGHLGGCFTCLY